MKKLWCSIWRAFLNAFQDAVDSIAYALDTLTPPVLNLLTGVGEVAGDILESAGSAINSVFGGSPLLWGGLLIGGYLLLAGKKEDKPPSTSNLSSGFKNETQEYPNVVNV